MPTVNPQEFERRAQRVRKASEDLKEAEARLKTARQELRDAEADFTNYTNDSAGFEMLGSGEIEFVQRAAKELSPCWKGYAEIFAMPLFGTLCRLVSSATLARLVQRVCADAADANEQKWMDLVDSTVARLETDRPTQGISSLDQALKKTPTFVAKAVRKVFWLAKKTKATDLDVNAT